MYLDVRIHRNGVSLNCLLNDNCIVQTHYTNNKEVTGKTSLIEVLTSDRNNANKLYNAIVYLISLALEKGYVRNEIIDPFTNHQAKNASISEPKDNSKTKQSNTASEISLNKEGGVFSLNLAINGVAIKFILDSGAGECSISIDTQKKLLAHGIITQTDYLSNGLYKLADGTVVENKRVRIPKMIIGNKTVYNVIASIGQVGSPNLLGQSFLKKFDQWSIDNSKQLLIIK